MPDVYGATEYIDWDELFGRAMGEAQWRQTRQEVRDAEREKVVGAEHRAAHAASVAAAAAQAAGRKAGRPSRRRRGRRQQASR